MSSIKFNQLTKEIELKGSESFIDSNFSKIQYLLVESFGVKKMAVPRKKVSNQEPVSLLQLKESQVAVEMKRPEMTEAPPMSIAAKSSIPEVSPASRVNRPPLRKYIRKAGMPGQQRVVVEVVDSRPNEISIAALKEKFGLSESKIGGIIRDAEKLGKVRRASNGSLIWSQD